MTGDELNKLMGIFEGTRSCDTKQDFIRYLIVHPHERFWQSVRNFSEYPFIIASVLPITGGGTTTRDTYYWENKNG